MLTVLQVMKSSKTLMRDYLTPVSDEIIEDNLGGIFGKNDLYW